MDKPSKLIMEKSDLDVVPEIALPPGYLLRTFQSGDELGLGRLYGLSSLGSESPKGVRAKMLTHPCFKAERIFIVEHNGEIIATCAAWVEPESPENGFLHMLGVLPGHQGKQLGTVVSVETIRYTRGEGFSKQRLLTDDWRDPAITLYFNLNFYPVITCDTYSDRWRVIGERVNRMDMVKRAIDAR